MAYKRLTHKQAEKLLDTLLERWRILTDEIDLLEKNGGAETPEFKAKRAELREINKELDRLCWIGGEYPGFSY